MASAHSSAPRPNIIYLHTHDTGRMVQPYGQPVPMPRLQAFAEQGVLFRQAYSAAPTCSPSRAALLTGQAPHSAGMMGLAHRGFGLHDRRQHLAHTLAGHGYAAAMIGQQHVTAGPGQAESLGYHEELTADGEHAAAIVPVALDYLRRDHDQPFFLSIGLHETHASPHGEGTYGYPGGDDRYVTPPFPLPNTPETRSDMADFMAAAKVADDAYGAVLDTLDEQGLADNTLVIITTDHGVALPKMKCTLSDLGTGVLLILRGPGFSGGQTSDALISQIDVFPTICEMLQVPAPPWLQGRSFLPVVRDGAPGNEMVFTEVTYHVSYEPQRAVRTPRWKYLRQFSDWGRPVLPNVDDSPSKDVLVQGGWRDRPVATEQLYDLLLDPVERINLADDPAYAEVADNLRGELQSWMERTADPLLDGPIPVPDGAPVLSQDRLSPSEG